MLSNATTIDSALSYIGTKQQQAQQHKRLASDSTCDDDNDNYQLTTAGKKVITHDVISIRPARSGDSPPMIITIPKKIVEAMKLKKGEDLRI